jgi:hypothetical protein
MEEVTRRGEDPIRSDQQVRPNVVLRKFPEVPTWNRRGRAARRVSRRADPGPGKPGRYIGTS